MENTKVIKVYMFISLSIYSGFRLGRTYIYRICNLARHLSLGSSMVRASNRSSEGCGFDPRLGLRYHFLSIELEDRSSTLKVYILAEVLKAEESNA